MQNWSVGVMEYWSNGKDPANLGTLSQYSNLPFYGKKLRSISCCGV